MTFVKQHAFWVGIGATVAVLLIIFLLLVFPQYTTISDFKDPQRGTLVPILKGLEKAPSSKKDTTNWHEHNATIKKDTEKITKFYEDCDTSLERWFPGLHRPGRDAFMARYRDEIRSLEQKLLDKGISLGITPKKKKTDSVPDFFEQLPDDFTLPGETPAPSKDPEPEPEEKASKGKYGFNWEMPTPREHFDNLSSVEEVTKVLKELQKRYWGRLRLANVILEGGVKVNRIVHVTFPKGLHQQIPTGPWRDEPTGPDALPKLDGGHSSGPMGYLEYDLPGKKARTLTFVAAVELPYSEVPKFIRELLNPASDADPKKRMLVTISSCRVTIRDQNVPSETITFSEKSPEEYEKKVKAVRDATKPQDVILVMRCHLIDYGPEQNDTSKRR